VDLEGWLNSDSDIRSIIVVKMHHILPEEFSQAGVEGRNAGRVRAMDDLELEIKNISSSHVLRNENAGAFILEASPKEAISIRNLFYVETLYLCRNRNVVLEVAKWNQS